MIITQILTEEHNENSDMDIYIVPETEFEPVFLPVAQNPCRVYLASLANGSHKTMLSALNRIADLLTTGVCMAENMPWWLIGLPHAKAVRAWLAQNFAPSTGNKNLSALRGVMKTCWELDLIDTDHWMKVSSVKSIKGKSLLPSAGRMITTGEFNSIMQVCINSKHKSSGIRDACIIGCGMYAGLRSEEIASMEFNDYCREERNFTITGKGRVTRQVKVTHGLQLALADWSQYRNDESKFMFQRVNKGGRILASGITSEAVQDVFTKRAHQAGVKNVTSHDGRRTFISTLLDNVDLSTVQRLVGHASTSTTAGYDRRDRRARDAAIDTLHMEWGSM